MAFVDFPLGFDGGGRTATTPTVDHARDMIEQVLFTTPGERVNRPDFGSGLLQWVFTPNNEELAATLQITTRAALQRWVGEIIDVRDVVIETSEETLRVDVRFALRADDDATHVASFQRSVP